MGQAGEATWKPGELARATGLTVRTLHHYDAIGLLRPSRRTRSGHRLYDARDLARLQEILALRALGLELDQVRAWLDRPGYDARATLRAQIAEVERKLDALGRLRDRLTGLTSWLDTSASTGRESAAAIVEVLRLMTNVERHYTPEQLEALARRRDALGEETIRSVEAEWPDLIARVRAAMDAGRPPSDPEVRALADRWMELVGMFTGGDPGIVAALERTWDREPGLNDSTGITPEMMAYIGQARTAGSTDGRS